MRVSRSPTVKRCIRKITGQPKHRCGADSCRCRIGPRKLEAGLSGKSFAALRSGRVHRCPDDCRSAVALRHKAGPQIGPMTVDIKTYVRPLGVQRQHGQISFAGTAFGVERPGLVVTAAHVVQDATPDRLHLEIARATTASDVRFRNPRSVTVHPSADLALLKFDEDDAIPYLKLAKPPECTGEFHLGTEIVSYGYPRRVESPSRVKLESRLLTGHIQRGVSPSTGRSPISCIRTELPFR